MFWGFPALMKVNVISTLTLVNTEDQLKCPVCSAEIHTCMNLEHVQTCLTTESEQTTHGRFLLGVMSHLLTLWQTEIRRRNRQMDLSQSLPSQPNMSHSSGEDIGKDPQRQVLLVFEHVTRTHGPRPGSLLLVLTSDVLGAHCTGPRDWLPCMFEMFLCSALRWGGGRSSACSSFVHLYACPFVCLSIFHGLP